jgi:hypothetical protein
VLLDHSKMVAQLCGLERRTTGLAAISLIIHRMRTTI